MTELRDITCAIWDHIGYLPPDTSERRPVLDLSKGGIEGWVDLVGWVHQDGLPVSRQSPYTSSNWPQCRLTALIEANALTTTLRRHPTKISYERCSLTSRCCVSAHWDLFRAGGALVTHRTRWCHTHTAVDHMWILSEYCGKAGAGGSMPGRVVSSTVFILS